MENKPALMRLAKFIAQTGYCARRKAEELILQGKVELNGAVVETVTTFIDPDTDQVSINGKACQRPARSVYIAVNKPSGYVSTTATTEKRKKVTDLIPDSVKEQNRLFLVGRLDRETEGLIIVTDDGMLAQRLMHPSFEKEKEYYVVVRGEMTQETADKLQTGVSIMVDAEPYTTAPAVLRDLQSDGKTTSFHLIIREGKKRQIRLMCKEVGHPVRYLQRVRIGPLSLGDLPLKSWRHLTDDEKQQLSSQ